MEACRWCRDDAANWRAARSPAPGIWQGGKWHESFRFGLGLDGTIYFTVNNPDRGVTIAELGYPGYEATNWYAFVAPAKTPKEIIERLNREIVRTLNTPETRDQFLRQGEEPSPSTPEELAKVMERESATWGRVVKEAGIQAQ